MRYFGIKMHNFLRFGETHNSIVFDVTEEQKKKINDGTISLDGLYNMLESNPSLYIEGVKKTEDDNVISGIVGIAGMTGGSFDSSNGAGKSTIFEAMAYANYDRIVRQTANNDKKAPAGLSVVTKLDGSYPDGMKESYVEEFFEEDGKLYRLKRGRSFTKSQKSSSSIFEFDCYTDDAEVDKLSGHRKRDTRESVDEVIVEDYDIFVNSVMFGQSDAGKFLTGTDKVKKEMIITLLKLEDVVSGCMDVIRENKKIQSFSVNSLKARIENLKELVIKDINEKSLEVGLDYEYDDSTIDFLVTHIRDELDGNIEEIKMIKDRSKELSKGIADLEGSEVIQKIKRLNEEGRKSVALRDEKLVKKDSEVADWKKILKDGEDGLKSNDSQIGDLKKGMEKSVQLIEDQKILIKKFNEEEVKDILSKCDKAAEVKGKYETMHEDALKKRDEILAKIAGFQAVIDTKKIEVSKLEAQVSSVEDGGKFVCGECKSVVAKNHILKKIEDGVKNLDENKELMGVLNDHLDKVNKAKASIDTRLTQIRNYAVEREKVTSLIEGNKNSKEMLKHHESRHKQLAEQIVVIENGNNSLRKKTEEYKDKVNLIETTFTKESAVLEDQIKKLREEIILLKKDVSEIETEIKSLKTEKSTLDKDKEALNTSNGSLQKEIDSIIDLGKKIADEGKELKEESKVLQRYVILEKAFGLDGVQTRIVQKYLPLLNMYIKEYLDILSDGKMSVKMTINSRSKVDMVVSGGTADSYNMLSGGEKMIVRLAVDVGLALLSFSRTAKKPDMICLDEIFGPLDNNHTKAVFRMLTELKNRFSRVFLISHKSEIQSLVSNNIIIEKSSGNRGLSKITGIGEISV